MSLFGGCGNNNDSSWIWVLVIVVLIFCCCNDSCGLLGGSNNDCGCSNECC